MRTQSSQRKVQAERTPLADYYKQHTRCLINAIRTLKMSSMSEKSTASSTWIWRIMPKVICSWANSSAWVVERQWKSGTLTKIKD